MRRPYPIIFSPHIVHVRCPDKHNNAKSVEKSTILLTGTGIYGYIPVVWRVRVLLGVLRVFTGKKYPYPYFFVTLKYPYPYP